MNNISRFNSQQLIDNHQIRVFLSSTFSDMQAERSALVKTFEKLKIDANRRNVNLSLLDLRWGVTDEEARTGKVISVCLNEIEHSHPFFIGLLGSRYGYAPKKTELEINPELIERYPWIEKDIDNELSITEMEMQYGVLRNHSDNDAAFFIKESDLPDDNPRLTELKNKIRKQDRYPVEDYSNVEELCEKVESAVLQFLDKHFPKMEVSALECLRNVHRAYINSRHAHYLERQLYFDIIDDFIRSEESHLVFTGESGIGKSALLANWIKKNEHHHDFNLVYHFVGNSFADNNYFNILSHLCEEISWLYIIDNNENRQETIEEKSQRLVDFVASCEKPLVVIIDGINQIATTVNEKLLFWIPNANKKVKFIFSTLREDETMNSFESRGYRVETVLPLNRDERRRFVEHYLSDVGKHLEDNQLQRIVDDPENENTLVLKTLLDELICFGVHEKLNERIDYYLSPPTIMDFFDRVLQRMEEDYSAEQDLVRHALTLIAVSEQGLTEDELLSILNCRQLDWHLFYCAFFNHFVTRNGLITFSHQFITNAVANRYHTKDQKATYLYRQEIVNHISGTSHEARRISELAHQYFNLADSDNLYDLLVDLDVFDNNDKIELILLSKYWKFLIAANPGKFQLLSYLDIPAEQNANTALKYTLIAHFVKDFIADYSAALEYYTKALLILEKESVKDYPDINTCYNNIGAVYDSKGDYFKALEYYIKSLKIMGESFDKKYSDEDYSAIINTYNNVATSYFHLGDYSSALDYYSEALNMHIKVFGKDHSDIDSLYNNVGCVYERLGKYSEALEYYSNALEIERIRFPKDHPSIARSYNNIGLLYDDQKDYTSALDYCYKALEIFKKNFGEMHPENATTYNNIGTMYRVQGESSKALECYFKAMEISENILEKNHPFMATVYNNIGLIYSEQLEYTKAFDSYIKALKIQESNEGIDQSKVAITYYNIACLSYKQGDFQTALKYSEKAFQLVKTTIGENHPTAIRINKFLDYVKLEINGEEKSSSV